MVIECLPLTRNDIAGAFEEDKDLFIPDVNTIDWHLLDYLGWVHPSGHLGYVVLQSPNTGDVRGIRMNRSLRTSRKKRMEMCSWCHHVHKSDGTAMFYYFR